MGTKLSNINLYNPYGAEYVLEKGFCSKNIVEGWDTILNDGKATISLECLSRKRSFPKLYPQPKVHNLEIIIA